MNSLSCSQCNTTVDAIDGIWSFAPGLTPPGFTGDRRAHLETIEGSHFWFGPRRALVEAVLDDRFEGGFECAIDLGCGGGTQLPVLAQRFGNVVGVDAYAESLGQARRHTLNTILVQADVCHVPLADRQFDLAMALDVLEHVDPIRFLAEARRLVVSEGCLLLTVPAFPSLWSPLDEAAGHRCRYRRLDLRRELEAHGWSVIHWTHYQALLFPLLWLARRSRIRRLLHFERYPSKRVSRMLGSVNSVEVRLLKGHRLPWGSSLVVLAQRQ